MTITRNALPFGNIKDYVRVSIDRDLYFVGGRLKVEAGAVGIIVGRDRGWVDVLFDDGPAYVELSGCNQRLQSVPVSDTSYL